MPCLFTLGQSWAALRKAWLGFKIAHSNGDIVTTRDYARIIRKLQVQMGIQVTVFDDDILSQEEAGDIFIQNSESKMKRKKQEQRTVDRSPDHDAVMNNVWVGQPRPSPRNEIFSTSRATIGKPVISDNACPSQPYARDSGTEKDNQGGIKKGIINGEFRYYTDTSYVDDQSTDEDQSSNGDDGDLENHLQSKVPDYTIHRDNGCVYPLMNKKCQIVIVKGILEKGRDLVLTILRVILKVVDLTFVQPNQLQQEVTQ